MYSQWQFHLKYVGGVYTTIYVASYGYQNYVEDVFESALHQHFGLHRQQERVGKSWPVFPLIVWISEIWWGQFFADKLESPNCLV